MKASAILGAIAAMREAEGILKRSPKKPYWDAYLRLAEARARLEVESGLSMLDIVIEPDGSKA